MMFMRFKLSKILEKVPPIYTPDRNLEQYSTPIPLALDILEFANKKGDISNRFIWDLGCGTGIFTFGAQFLGAKLVIGVDVDLSSLLIANKLRKGSENEKNIQFIASSLEFPAIKPYNYENSTVLMNPPFGTNFRRGIDILFLKLAFRFAGIVYSLHKSNKKTQMVIKKEANEFGYFVDVCLKKKLLIPKMFKTHQKNRYPVDVDFFRIIKKSIS